MEQGFFWYTAAGVSNLLGTVFHSYGYTGGPHHVQIILPVTEDQHFLHGIPKGRYITPDSLRLGNSASGQVINILI